MGFGNAVMKCILITGSTDGLGLEAAKLLAGQGNAVLLHGRSKSKLERAKRAVRAVPGAGPVETYSADLSKLEDVEKLAERVMERHDRLDVLVNNAGVFRTSHPATSDGRDVRFVVNALAPYLLTKRLLPRIPPATGRVVNVSSAAQRSVDTAGFLGPVRMDDFDAYGQSKLAITMWTNNLASELGQDGPTVMSLNPASMLGTKMVQEGFGAAGKDVMIGADIIARAATSEEFDDSSGKYYDNDYRMFRDPHRDALNKKKCKAVVDAMEKGLVR